MTHAQPAPGPARIERPLPLADDIALAVREFSHDYWARTQVRPQVLVLAGARVWRELLRDVGRHPWWRFGATPSEVLGQDGSRVVHAGIPTDEWKLALLTEWRGSLS